MGALTATSSPASAFTATPMVAQPAALSAMSQGGGVQSALLQGLTNYYNGQTNAAGNPNAVAPSLGDSLFQAGNTALNNSNAGQAYNMLFGGKSAVAPPATASASSPLGQAASDTANAANQVGSDVAASQVGSDVAAEDAGSGSAASGGDDAAAGGASDGAGAAMSVICGAYYSRNMLPRNIWICAQRYGQSVSADTFAGYLVWATPIARRIGTSSCFARLTAWLLIPVGNEMAIANGVHLKSTLQGRIVLMAGYALSFVLGKMLRLKGACHGVLTKA